MMRLKKFFYSTGAFLAGLFGRKLGSWGASKLHTFKIMIRKSYTIIRIYCDSCVNVLKIVFKKIFTQVEEATRMVIVSVYSIKPLEVLKQLPRWAKRVNDLYFYLEIRLRLYRDWLHFCVRFEYILVRYLVPSFAPAVRVFIRALTGAVITYLTDDISHYLDALLSGSINPDFPSEQVDSYISTYEHRHEIDQQRQETLNPKWYGVGWGLIIIAVITLY